MNCCNFKPRSGGAFSYQALGGAVAAGRDYPSQAVELLTLIEETEDMKTSDRGMKHVCPKCATKYYDLRKEVVACPKCGAKPLPKTTQPARKIGRTASGGYR